MDPLLRAIFRRPEEHPRLSAEKRDLIIAGRASGLEPGPKLSYATLLRMPKTLGVILSKTLTDPVWFSVTDWLAILLVARGYSPKDNLLAFWIPFLAADVGNFTGGGFLSYLITRGWQVGTSRKIVCVLGAIGMSMLALPVFVNGFAVLVASLAIASLVRPILDHHPHAARGSLPSCKRRECQRDERNRRGTWSHRRSISDRRRFGPLLVWPDTGCCELSCRSSQPL